MDSNDPTIFFNRGNVYMNMVPPKYQDAHRDYDIAISLDRLNPKLWHSKGLAFQTEAEVVASEKHTVDNEIVIALN